MMSFNFGDDNWDEFAWEAHINEIEEKSEKLRDFINTTWGDKTPAWYRFVQEYKSDEEAVDAFVEEELMFEEAYFPDDDDWELDDDDEDDDIFFSAENEADDDDEFADGGGDYDEGEGWKQDSDEFIMSDYGTLENLQIYEDSRSLGVALLNYARAQAHLFKNPPFSRLISQVLQVTCKLASGYSFGFEYDVLGANIAY